MKARPGHFFNELILAMLAGIVLLCASCEAPAGPGPDGGDTGGITDGGSGVDDDGDGDGGDPLPSAYIADLLSGVGTDVSALSGKNLYVIFSVMPESKPESDSGLVPGGTPPVDCILCSAAVPESRSIVSVSPEVTIPAGSVLPADAATWPFPSQIASDNVMRGRENSLLALPRPPPPVPEASALSGPDGPLFSRAPETFGVGTVWSGIRIERTNAVINAVCAQISDHAVFYVDERDTDDPDLSSERLAAFATSFDGIHAVCRERFGTEGDFDGNGTLLVVFTRELSGGLLGYFNPADKFDTETSASSNEGDILYLTAGSYSIDEICATLSHEFQHMIYFDEHWRRGSSGSLTWLNEALSQAAEYYCGYQDFHLFRIGLFLSHLWDEQFPVHWYELSLTHWSDFNYGYGAVFVRYLIDRYGNDAVKNMCATDKTGIAAVEAATGTDFNAVFAGFLRALVLSGTSSTAAPGFRFTSLDLRALQGTGETPFVPEADAYTAGNSSLLPAHPYSIHFLKCAGSFTSVTLNGSDACGAMFAFDPQP